MREVGIMPPRCIARRAPDISDCGVEKGMDATYQKLKKSLTSLSSVVAAMFLTSTVLAFDILKLVD